VFTHHGDLDTACGTEHLARVLGNLAGEDAPLVRVHSECLTGEVFGSLRCDCAPQLTAAMARIGAAGRGVIVYLRGHEGRGIGLLPKLQAYALQDEGADTIQANRQLGFADDQRDYAAAAWILKDLGVLAMKLLTNNARKHEALSTSGLRVHERVALVIPVQSENRNYLLAKQRLLGHALELQDECSSQTRVRVCGSR
jgi:3,4-dihydroxy 2-butanone 4-phosphate synthase/GTP cyclohydrolase II